MTKEESTKQIKQNIKQTEAALSKLRYALIATSVLSLVLLIVVYKMDFHRYKTVPVEYKTVQEQSETGEYCCIEESTLLPLFDSYSTYSNGASIHSARYYFAADAEGNGCILLVDKFSLEDFENRYLNNEKPQFVYGIIKEAPSDIKMSADDGVDDLLRAIQNGEDIGDLFEFQEKNKTGKEAFLKEILERYKVLKVFSEKKETISEPDGFSLGFYLFILMMLSLAGSFVLYQARRRKKQELIVLIRRRQSEDSSLIE